MLKVCKNVCNNKNNNVNRNGQTFDCTIIYTLHFTLFVTKESYQVVCPYLYCSMNVHTMFGIVPVIQIVGPCAVFILSCTNTRLFSKLYKQNSTQMYGIDSPQYVRQHVYLTERRETKLFWRTCM